MPASEFIIEHIIEVLGGAGALVMGLSTYLGKLWADKSLLKEGGILKTKLKEMENKHLMEIKLLEKALQLELAKKDQFHQISKTTYESLFDKKISIYSDLLKLKMDYDRFKNESGSFEYIDPTNEFLSHFKLFKEKIEENRLYISNEISEKYDAWYKQAAPYFQRIEEVEVSAYANQSPSTKVEPSPQDIWENQEPIICELVSDTFEKMSQVISQIDSDVREIRRNMSVVCT